MNNKNEKTYISPEVEVMVIETEQSILSASLEKLGDIFDDQDW